MRAANWVGCAALIVPFALASCGASRARVGADGTADSEPANAAGTDAGSSNALAWALWPMPNGKDDISGGAPNPSSYSDNMDGTVTDRVTNLIWQQRVPTTGGANDDGNLTWAEATEYCATLSLAGHRDWRLPAQIELVSLLDYSDLGQGQPPINGAFFPDTPSEAFWSSTQSANSDTVAWTVYMDVGFTYAYDVTTVGRVRCVR
ncbi:MAG TPA: DUF1566 domain-containing protein [Polyangiaceae bacterium]|nr:DUF1566 domain-containing protein [Polyangiaceae bacterium]